MIQENSRYTFGFNPYSIESIPHQKEDAIRTLGIELANKLTDGNRIVVKLDSFEPSEYQLQEFLSYGRYGVSDWQQPIFMYELDIGIARERILEVTIFNELQAIPEPLPDYKIELTNSVPMINELLKRLLSKIRYQLRWWTMAQVEADIAAWRESEEYI